MTKIDPGLIREIFDYRDGTLVWRVNTGKKRLVGSIAGACRADGYWRVGIFGRDYYLHHLVWAWHRGEWPRRLDHADTNQGNNWIGNLRVATQSQNIANSKVRRSGLKGAYPVTDASTYRSAITVAGKSINLGNYGSEREAHEAYVAAARLHFGEFARAA
jgi:hypothetical protein